MRILYGWQFYALASAFFAGLVVLFAKVGVESIPSNMATFIRTVVITVFLVVLISWRGEWTPLQAIDKRGMVFLILSGLATGVSWICYFKALSLGPATGVAPLDKLSLVFAVFFAALFLGEHLNWLQCGGVALMVAGALLVALK